MLGRRTENCHFGDRRRRRRESRRWSVAFGVRFGYMVVVENEPRGPPVPRDSVVVDCLRDGANDRKPPIGSLTRERMTATWLILPVVICLSQRLSHACLSTNLYTVKLRMAH